MKPKAGLFCFLITEARETTSLEMPDNHQHTFVLKVKNVPLCETLANFWVDLFTIFRVLILVELVLNQVH